MHRRMEEWLMTEIILMKLIKDKFYYTFVTITIQV